MWLFAIAALALGVLYVRYDLPLAVLLVMLGVGAFSFLRHELPALLLRRRLEREKPRFLMLTAHGHWGLCRRGKSTRKTIL